MHKNELSLQLQAHQAYEMDVLPKWRRSVLRIMQKVSFRKSG